MWAKRCPTPVGLKTKAAYAGEGEKTERERARETGGERQWQWGGHLTSTSSTHAVSE
jgi:hypothetical protein